jgi:cell division protein FtsB
MSLTENETRLLLWAFVALLGVLAYIGKLGVSHLKSIATSVNKMERDLSVLTNDHTNLKEEVKEVKCRVTKLEDIK